jgi:Copper amine oxidase N-terminal domain
VVTRSVALLAAFSIMTGASALADANFGLPPSGEVPILFNDHHVYASPSTLRQGRVLAALAKEGTLLVPMRSMFEQMGATVSFVDSTKMVKASKPGLDVQVTLNKAEVVINGEARPLDVPPMMYKGVLLVPVRVISEALGAYVEWVPDERVAVVRYVAPTPVPAPTQAATPAPAPAPMQSAPPEKREGWQFAVTPYLWLPSIKGVINYDTSQIPGGGPGQISLNVAPNDYLNKLDSGLAFAVGAHTNYVDVFSDFLWMNSSNTNTTSATVMGPLGKVQLPVTFQSGARLVTNIGTVGVGAPIFEDEHVTADLFIGGRFSQLKSSVSWTLTSPSPFLNTNGSASFNTTLYDLIGGAKGDIYITPDKAWYIPYYADVGSGTFGSTWQYVGGIGYGKRGSLEVLYRGLAYTSSAGHVPNLRFYGPAVGYTFRF